MVSFKKYLEIIQEEEELKNPKLTSKLMGLLMLFPNFSVLSENMKKDIAVQIQNEPEMIKQLENKQNLKDVKNYNNLQKRIQEVITKRNQEKKQIVKEIIDELNKIDPSYYAYADREFNDLIKRFEKEFTKFKIEGFTFRNHPFNTKSKEQFINFMNEQIKDL